MKTEAEIRAHVEALKAARSSPCDCGGSRHAIECAIGGRMLDAEIEGLLWALGESPRHEAMVAAMGALHQRRTGGGK